MIQHASARANGVICVVTTPELMQGSRPLLQDSVEFADSVVAGGRVDRDHTRGIMSEWERLDC
jgi:hypothetical protein